MRLAIKLPNHKIGIYKNERIYAIKITGLPQEKKEVEGIARTESATFKKENVKYT